MEEENETFLPLQHLRLEDENNDQDQEDGSSSPDIRNEEDELNDEHKEENSKISRVKEIHEITGYEFHGPNLLQQAFTHHTYKEGICPSFERLAFVGDAVLDLFFATDHYSLYPDLDPGKLTRLRAANVDTEKLARVALKHHLHTFLRHDIFLLAAQIEEFEKAVKEYPVHSSGLIDAPKVLADIVESLVGAIYIDSDSSMDTTCKIVKNLLEPIISPASLSTQPVTLLYEICQREKLTLKMRDTWKENGEIEFLVVKEEQEELAVVNNVGRAKYSGKKVIAKNRAALNAYSQIIQMLNHQS
ncbi:hypothetical protein ABFX02_08G114000 [Erythranthe guttata]